MLVVLRGRSDRGGKLTTAERPTTRVEFWDVSTGRRTGMFSLPAGSALLAVAPDAGHVVTGLGVDQPATRTSCGRIDIWTAAGKHVAGMVAAEAAGAVGPRARFHWVALRGDDLFTVADDRLTRWSLARHAALWSVSGLSPTAAISHGSSLLAAMTRNRILVLSAASGQVLRSMSVSELAAPARPDWFAFDREGKHLLEGTLTGVRRWALATGKKVNTPPQEGVSPKADMGVIPLGSGRALRGRALIDLGDNRVIWNYTPAGGLFLADGPDGRAWYLARQSVPGTYYLSAATLPLAADAETIEYWDRHKPLIRPHVVIAGRVSVPTASAEASKILQTALAGRGYAGRGRPVATLRVTVSRKPTGQTMTVRMGSREEKHAVYAYEGSCQLVANGRVLWKIAPRPVHRTDAYGAVIWLGPKQTFAQKEADDAKQAVLNFVRGAVSFPRYISADGKAMQGPFSTLPPMVGRTGQTKSRSEGLWD